jgi:hypothetical protein
MEWYLRLSALQVADKGNGYLCLTFSIPFAKPPLVNPLPRPAGKPEIYSKPGTYYSSANGQKV